MAKEISIMLSTDKIRAAAGEKVNVGALFDQFVYASIYENGKVNGWKNIIKFQEKVRTVSYEVEIHEDTTHFVIVANPDAVARLDDAEHTVEAAFIVEVTSEPQPEPEPMPTPTPEPEPEPTKELGKHQYNICVASDVHLYVDNDENTPEKTDDWSDEKDLRTMMDICGADKSIMCVMSAGDSIESGSPKLGTPEDDSKEFMDIYNVNYWQIYGLRFFSCVGNHDFYGMFESRNGDTIRPDRFTNYNSIDGHNVSVRDRIAQINVSGNGINCYVANGRNRISFDLEPGKSTLTGQADMHFLAYNAYVCDYATAAGYTGKLVPSENRLSDDAMRMTKKYVNDNWGKCKNYLTGWDTGNGMRNAYSKLNYFLKKDNNIFIHLSVDYGDDVWPLNDKWHDRMIRARKIIDINSDDPYIRAMVEFVADTGYSEKDRPYDYQYYSPNSLIWLKEIIENNQDKKIFPFIHHYMANKVGNGVGLPKDGNWSYAAIHPADELDANGIPVGSNCLTGIEFYFLNKLNNMYKNCLYSFGHSHMSNGIEQKFKIDNHDYPIVPAGQPFGYTKASLTPIGTSAWNLALPSLSKPRGIEGKESVRLYDDAEMTIFEIYENGVIVKGYKIVKDGKKCFDKSKPMFEKSILLR